MDTVWRKCLIVQNFDECSLPVKRALIIYFYYYIHALAAISQVAAPRHVATSTAEATWVYVCQYWRLVALLKRAFAVHVKARHTRRWPCFSVNFITLFPEKYTRRL